MDIHRIPLPAPGGLNDVNAYLLPGDEPVLVDPGPKGDAAYEALHDGLAQHDHRITDIEHILITHPHADHFGNASRVKQEAGAVTYAHQQAAPIIEDHERHVEAVNAFYAPYFRHHGMPEEYADNVAHRCIPDPEGTSVEIDAAIKPGNILEISESIICIDAPGHARGNLVLRQGETLITGDTVLADITPNPTLQLPQNSDEPPHSLAAYLDTLHQLQELGDLDGYGGHGPRIPDVAERCSAIIHHHSQRKEEIYHLLDDGAKTAYRLMQDLFTGIKTHQHYFGMSEIIGHLQLLENDDLIQREDTDPVAFTQR